MTFTLSASIVSRNRQLRFAVQIALGFRWGLFFLRRKPLMVRGVQHFKNKYKPGIRPVSQREITSVRHWQSPGRQAGKGWREHHFWGGGRDAEVLYAVICAECFCLRLFRWNSAWLEACTGMAGWPRGHPWAHKGHACPHIVFAVVAFLPALRRTRGSPGGAHLPEGIKLPRLKLFKFTLWHFETFFIIIYLFFQTRALFPLPGSRAGEFIFPVPNRSQRHPAGAERGSKGETEPSSIGNQQWDALEKLPGRIRMVALSCKIRWFKVSLSSC